MIVIMISSSGNSSLMFIFCVMFFNVHTSPKMTKPEVKILKLDFNVITTSVYDVVFFNARSQVENRSNSGRRRTDGKSTIVQPEIDVECLVGDKFTNC